MLISSPYLSFSLFLSIYLSRTHTHTLCLCAAIHFAGICLAVTSFLRLYVYKVVFPSLWNGNVSFFSQFGLALFNEKIMNVNLVCLIKIMLRCFDRHLPVLLSFQSCCVEYAIARNFKKVGSFVAIRSHFIWDIL